MHELLPCRPSSPATHAPGVRRGRPSPSHIRVCACVCVPIVWRRVVIGSCPYRLGGAARQSTTSVACCSQELCSFFCHSFSSPASFLTPPCLCSQASRAWRRGKGEPTAEGSGFLALFSSMTAVLWRARSSCERNRTGTRPAGAKLEKVVPVSIGDSFCAGPLVDGVVTRPCSDGPGTFIQLQGTVAAGRSPDGFDGAHGLFAGGEAKLNRHHRTSAPGHNSPQSTIVELEQGAALTVAASEASPPGHDESWG